MGNLVRHPVHSKAARAEWQELYVEGMRRFGRPTLAARYAGVTKGTVEKYYESDEVFQAAVDEAWDENTDALMYRHYEAAMEGDTISRIHELKARRPELYRDNYTVTHQGKVDHRGSIDLRKLSDGELAHVREMLRKAQDS